MVTYHQSFKQDLRKTCNHEVHFSEQIVRSEHIPVLGADPLDSFQRQRLLVKIGLLVHGITEVLPQLIDQVWPVPLHKSLSQQRNDLQETRCYSLLLARHHQVH